MFWLTTVEPDGRPHSTPAVAAWLDGALHFLCGAHEHKVNNLRTNPRVELLTSAGDWQHGLDIVVRGLAEPVSEPAVLERLAAAWRHKWDGRWQYEPAPGGGFVHPGGGEQVNMFSVTPSIVFAFGRGPFSQTRYGF